MRLTASRSEVEKCSPTPNISNMTPISDSCEAICHIGDESRCCRADHDAREQVADQGRDLEALGDEAEYQGETESGGNRGDQRYAMFHSFPSDRLADLYH